MGLQQVLDALIAEGKPIQIQLRGTNQPMGPGKVERIADGGASLWRLWRTDEKKTFVSEHGWKDEAERQLARYPAGDVELKEVVGYTSCYRILCPAMLQTNPQARPVQMILPILFDVDDLLMIYEEPLNAAGEKANVTPSDSRGSGLIIPGRPRNG